MKFTFAYITYKNDVYNQYLKPCLDNIRHKVDVITKSGLKPSKFYNEVQKESKNRYIIFTHEDITFSSNILEKIQETIEKFPNFGVLCAVGKNEVNKNIMCRASTNYFLKFCDPCFFVIDKDNNYFFDENTFDDFHFCAEDYCVGIKDSQNKDVISLPLNWGIENNPNSENDVMDAIKHHSYTCRTVRYQWGNYPEYKSRFKKKWDKFQNIKIF